MHCYWIHMLVLVHFKLLVLSLIQKTKTTFTIKDMVKVTISSAVISVFVLAFYFHKPVNSNPLLSDCIPTTVSYTSSFEHNLKTLLKSLVNNTPSSTGYNDTSYGEGLDQVYGQALCRGDVNVTDCQKCLESASQGIMNKCKTTRAIIWYEVCQIHYFPYDFRKMQIYAGKKPEKSYHRKKVAHPDQFRLAWTKLIKKLSDEAINDSNGTMFKTGDTEYSKGKIYGLVQCTRDIPKRECKICLRSALGDIQGFFPSEEGGIILSSNCNVRFEIFRFFYTQSSKADGSMRHKGKKRKILLVASCTSSLLVILMCSFAVYLRRKKNPKQDEVKSQNALLSYSLSPRAITVAGKDDELVSTEELPFMDLATISAATDGFSDHKKLGQGGFGCVYKGVLPDGKEVAVKRLSGKSWQGDEEFKNELVLIAKLQHRNLVRLLGCAVEGQEKLLVYEFMPNNSLDSFIFDSDKRALLDWKTRYSIICGIARGLLYLHEDSRLRIIHRDLKPSNVLLDSEMVAKISDFGLARIFCEDQNTANTKKVVGTYGYMAPEYAMDGQFSAKSDAFSFGVILLEIISGKKSCSSHLSEKAQTLIRYAWQLWREGKEVEFVDPLMMESSPTEDIIRCMHIGLLCVQEDPNDRPTMSSVVVLLGSGTVGLFTKIWENKDKF
ncbi:cysteine-rich receptor-like protein kinase 15 isoform X1 [Cannabis sativa]|uniref:cysteine-rich receptor-like protein kinase 15 isoform X1 n=1 Tax=Cannabis sativa TaxID=3483 RepID=UPI0029CA5EA6|nr:cysteine-rich receptor-like protein kinase 15 isoform X1 [Cannabis sativa]